MADAVINFPRDTTLRELNAIQRAAAAGSANPGAADLCYKYLVACATTKEQVDSLFVEWWKAQYDSGKYTKVQMLERWFGSVLDDDRVHGCTIPLYSTSTSAIGELTDDSVGLVCTPSTSSTLGRDDFAHLPQFWCLEVSAEKKADGSHEIYYVEHIDDIDDVRSGEHLCWVLQKNTYVREWRENGYQYLKMKCHQTPGYKQWREGKDRTGHVYAYMAHPKYYAGKVGGKASCGTGLAPINYTSHTAGVTLWNTRGTQYSGASGSLPKFLDRMTRLKYARKGNSGTIEGCSAYNYQYKAAVAETGVKRFILTTAQAANLFVGSAVSIGTDTDGATDRNIADVHDIATEIRITAIEPVTLNDTEYAAVYVDAAEAFDTVAGTTLLSTMPYFSGWNDTVLGTDGSRYSATSGKEPGLLQKIEFMNGSYLIVSDEIWEWGKDENEDYTFSCYLCKDQSKVSGTAVTDDYTKLSDLTLTLPKDTMTSWHWQYIEDTDCGDVEWPTGVNASGSGVGCKAGFICVPSPSGLRAAWCFGNLNDGGNDGVACRNSNHSLGTANWNGSLGATGYKYSVYRNSLHHSILAYVRKLLETGGGWYCKGRPPIVTR